MIIAAIWLAVTTAFATARDLTDVPFAGAYLALAVVALLAMVVPLTLTGYATFHGWGDGLGGDWLAELHEFFGNTALSLVGVHLALLAGQSYWRQKNLALPMITGRMEGRGPDLIAHNRVWLAILLLLCVLAYIGSEIYSAGL